MTETGMLTSNPLEGDRRAGTVGKPLPGTQLRIVDDDDRPIAVGSIGHIQVRGASVLPGYWQMPEKNAEEFTDDGFFRTGDMGSVSADEYVTIVGRSKDLIITGGYNVYPKEIELAIGEIEGVQESAGIRIPHADFGEAAGPGGGPPPTRRRSGREGGIPAPQDEARRRPRAQPPVLLSGAPCARFLARPRSSARRRDRLPSRSVACAPRRARARRRAAAPGGIPPHEHGPGRHRAAPRLAQRARAAGESPSRIRRDRQR